jgi:RAV-like factor
MKLPSSKHRGVVAQQSGKWGAQIYKNDERIWLGTFCTEVEAAQTYDLAAQCLHGAHAVTNFNPFSNFDKDTEEERLFLKSRTTTEILRMLRMQTYHEELKRCRQMHRIQHMLCKNAGNVISNSKETRELLFYKLVSPGDVGPQNRLLIPRLHAQKHFPLFQGSKATGSRGIMINFEDEEGTIWRFRYAYWSSSGNHVLNGGWAQFAREKDVRPGDVVQFWRVTNELGDIRLFIECDRKRTATVPVPPTLETPVMQPDKKIRLFGVNVSVSVSPRQN